MTQRYVAAKEAFQRLTQLMCTKVSIPVSDRYNAVYGEEDLHHALALLSIEGRYAESGMRRLAMEASSTRVPSGSWVRDAVSRLSEEDAEAKAERAMGSTLEELKRFGVFNEPVVCAMDKHLIPRYDGRLEPFITRGKKKAGTTKFETYATLQCVEEGRRAQVACSHARMLDDNTDILTGLLERARLQEVDVSLLLLDREFFSASVVARLGKLGQRFLMPCRLTKGVKEAIRERARGGRKKVSRCALMPSRSSGIEAAAFTIVILPRKGCEDEPDPLNRYIAFATNIPRRFVMWNLRRLPDEYRRRWGIETGYSNVEGFRARTTSRSHSLRLLYFFYALVLYNAWLLANLIMARELSRRLAGPIIRIQVFKATLYAMVVNSFASGG
jgi:hypothetical protein